MCLTVIWKDVRRRETCVSGIRQKAMLLNRICGEPMDSDAAMGF